MEEFGNQFEVFKNNFLVDTGITDTTIGERFNGALMSSSLAQTRLKLQKMVHYNSIEEQLPRSTTIIPVIGNEVPVNIAIQSTSIHIGRKCTSCDNITSYPNQENGKIYFRLEEWKSSLFWQDVESAGVSPGKIISERKKAIEGIQLMTENLNLNQKTFFSLMSNAPLKTPRETINTTILHTDDTMIVSRDQFENYFSPTFSCLAVGYIEDKVEVSKANKV